METRMLGTAITLFLLSVPTAMGAVLVDINGAEGPTMSGYTPWGNSEGLVVSDDTAMNESHAFADAALSTDGTVDVTLTSLSDSYERNYTNVTGSLSDHNNLFKDLVLFNDLRCGNNYIQVQLDDLKAGNYRFTGYHVLTQNSGAATVDIYLNGTDTGQDVTQLIDQSADDARASVVDFTVASDNDPVTIRYQAHSSGGNHFGLNAFELDLAPPTDGPLRVDFSRQSVGLLQSGWEGFGHDGTSGHTESFGSWFGTDGTVELTAQAAYWRDYPAVTGTFAADSHLLRDGLLVNNNSDNITLTLDDLTAGIYEMTTYHVNTLANGGRVFDIYVDGVLTETGLTTTNGTSPTTITAPTFLFTANGADPVTLLFDPTGGSGHLHLSGFAVSWIAIPEPTTFLVWSLLAGLGIGMGWRRRTK